MKAKHNRVSTDFINKIYLFKTSLVINTFLKERKGITICQLYRIRI